MNDPYFGKVIGGRRVGTDLYEREKRILRRRMGCNDGPSLRYYAAGNLSIMLSDFDQYGEEEEADHWRHVSVFYPHKNPNYAIQKAVRTVFFPPDAEVIQVFPPVDEFVNMHEHCLHLWWNRDRRLTPEIMRGAV